jgi:hypothetical protein
LFFMNIGERLQNMTQTGNAPQGSSGPTTFAPTKIGHVFTKLPAFVGKPAPETPPQDAASEVQGAAQEQETQMTWWEYLEAHGGSSLSPAERRALKQKWAALHVSSKALPTTIIPKILPGMSPSSEPTVDVKLTTETGQPKPPEQVYREAYDAAVKLPVTSTLKDEDLVIPTDKVEQISFWLEPVKTYTDYDGAEHVFDFSKEGEWDRWKAFQESENARLAARSAAQPRGIAEGAVFSVSPPTVRMPDEWTPDLGRGDDGSRRSRGGIPWKVLRGTRLEGIIPEEVQVSILDEERAAQGLPTISQERKANEIAMSWYTKAKEGFVNNPNPLATVGITSTPHSAISPKMLRSVVGTPNFSKIYSQTQLQGISSRISQRGVGPLARAIRELVSKRGYNVNELATELQVSEESVQVALQQLSKAGLVKLTRTS